MASLVELNSFLDTLLDLPRFAADASNNGLQFQGADKVEKAVFAVDACEAVFHAAADLDADFIFVKTFSMIFRVLSQNICFANFKKFFYGVKSEK